MVPHCRILFKLCIHANLAGLVKVLLYISKHRVAFDQFSSFVVCLINLQAEKKALSCLFLCGMKYFLLE